MDRIVPLIILFLSLQTICAQSYQIELSTGASIYNGDLAHHHPLFSKDEMNLSVGFSAGYYLHNSLLVKLGYMQTKVEGSDEFASNSALKNRNLHFYSTINELYLSTEWHFMKLLPISMKHFNLFVEAGIGFFRFNPMATYEGEAYELQKYSTEGQGLPGSENDPYDLVQPNWQIGLGMTFKLTKNLDVALKSKVRILNTDYLDDVSGSYYHLPTLTTYKGKMSALLSYRNLELIDKIPHNIEGQPRGNTDNDDSYLVHSVSLKYSF